jgi:hypothetical protein
MLMLVAACHIVTSGGNQKFSNPLAVKKHAHD